jgi:hypothetical protein
MASGGRVPQMPHMRHGVDIIDERRTPRRDEMLRARETQ